MTEKQLPALGHTWSSAWQYETAVQLAHWRNIPRWKALAILPGVLMLLFMHTLPTASPVGWVPSGMLLAIFVEVVLGTDKTPLERDRTAQYARLAVCRAAQRLRTITLLAIASTLILLVTDLPLTMGVAQVVAEGPPWGVPLDAVKPSTRVTHPFFLAWLVAAVESMSLGWLALARQAPGWSTRQRNLLLGVRSLAVGGTILVFGLIPGAMLTALVQPARTATGALGYAVWLGGLTVLLCSMEPRKRAALGDDSGNT